MSKTDEEKRQDHLISIRDRQQKIQELKNAPKFREYIKELLTLTGMTIDEMEEYDIEQEKKKRSEYQKKYRNKTPEYNEYQKIYQAKYRKKQKLNGQNKEVDTDES